MFKSLSSSNNSRKLHSQLETLTFSRELTSNPDVTFNTTPYPNAGGIIGYDGEISCISYDAVQSLLAVSTKSGRVTLYADFGRLPRLTWSLKPAIAIHHLLLKAGTSYLLAVDAKDTLHLFDYADLDERGEPKRLLSHSMRSRVNCIESTPSLSHIFIACQDGCVDTFDVERGTVAPYRIKNLWIEQDELLRRSGVPNAPSKKRIPACVEARSHPLDPNQILIAYEGGIVLYNITERHTVRTYEYIILPGAPGGHDDQTEGAFLERRPMCTCLAWRPDGRMFAAGYDDGSFALWSIEDGDKPVMARTIKKEDVNLATSSNLFGDDASAPSDIPGAFREPIYKLAWCGFGDSQSSTHKGTILVVLGGTMPDDAKGLHCLNLPAFSAPSIINASNPKFLLEAYKASVRSNYTSIIPTDTAPEDFVLLTHNPYYGQTYDPHSVLIMLSHDTELPEIAPHTQRGFVAFPFPPSMGTDPTPLQLPMDLSLTGSQSAVWAEAMTLSGATRMRLHGEQNPAERLPLTGGEAKLVITPAGHHKIQDKHHAVFTVSLDMTVKIWDYTKLMPRLLNSYSARDGLSDDQLMQYIDGQMLVEQMSAAWDTTEMAFGLSTGDVLFYKFQYAKPEAVRHQQELDECHYRSESASGHFMHGSGSNSPRHDGGLAAATSRININTPSPKPYQHHQEAPASSRRLFGRKKETRHGQDSSTSSVQSTSFEINLQDSSHLSDWSKDGFKPIFSLSLEEDRSGSSRRITALNLSEAGFIAVAWGTKLAILDLRGPEVLYSENEGGRNGNVTLLTWTICAEGSDPEHHPRLLATYESGITRIYTLSYVLDTWIVNQQMESLRHEESRNAIAHIVLDSHGNVLGMHTGALDQCLRASEQGESPSHHRHTSDKAFLNSISVIVGSNALTVFGNLSGDRLIKRDFGNSKAIAAMVVQKYAMPVLMVLLNDGQCAILSLPNCEVVRTMQIPYGRSWPSVSADGRVFQTLSPSFFNYFTIFPDQLPVPIQAKYYLPERVLPPAPGSSVVSTAGAAAVTYISSWFSGETAKKWEPVSLDDVCKSNVGAYTSKAEDCTIVGGPNRPAPRPGKQALEALNQTTAPASSTTGPRAKMQSVQSSLQRPSRDRVKEVQVEYNAFGMPKKRHELTDALEERGERLDFLNQHLDNASQASQDFLSQARRTAMMQSAKGAATGVGKGAMYSINKMLS